MSIMSWSTTTTRYYNDWDYDYHLHRVTGDITFYGFGQPLIIKHRGIEMSRNKTSYSVYIEKEVFRLRMEEEYDKLKTNSFFPSRYATVNLDKNKLDEALSAYIERKCKIEVETTDTSIFPKKFIESSSKSIIKKVVFQVCDLRIASKSDFTYYRLSFTPIEKIKLT